MQVSRTCGFTVDQALAAMRAMVRADMEAAGAEIPADDAALAGITYSKQLTNRMGKPERATVTVETLDETGYCVRFDSRYGANTVTYAFSPRADGALDVTYEESFEGATSSTGISHRLFATLTGRGNRKRMEAQLERLEQYILAQGV